MAVQVQKSKAAAKLGAGLNKAIAEGAASTDLPQTGFVNLPPGIDNGVARLEKCGFVEYKAGTKQKKADGSSAAGEYYFEFVGVCMAPKAIIPIRWDGPDTSGGPVKCQGRQTRVMINCFDTVDGSKKVTTQSEHINGQNGVMAYLRLLGGESYTQGCDTLEKLERLAAGLAQANPPIYFGLTTSETYDETKKNPKTGKPYPPRTWENWQQAIEDYTPPAANGFTDNTGEAGPEAPAPEPDAPDEAAEDTPIEASGEATTVDVDLDALVVAASKKKQDAESKAAATKLTELALAAGHAKDVVEADTATWADVANMIRSPKTEEEAPEPEEEEATWEPKVGDVITYNRPGISKTTNKPFKPSKCKITALNTAKKECDLLSTIDNKTAYKAVKLEFIAQVV